VKRTARSGLVDVLDCLSELRGCGIAFARRSGGADLLRSSLQRRSDGLVPNAASFVLTVPFDLGLDVRHGGRL
jgi:hypothetical protein